MKKRKESSEVTRGKSSGVSVVRVVGGAVLVLVAVGVLTSLHDIRRYWNMTRM
jgi:hypothetical protein